MCEEFRQWVKKYCWPISNAINGLQATVARQLLVLAEANLPDAEEQPLEWEGYAAALIWHQYIVNRAFAPKDSLPAIIKDHLAQLKDTLTTSLGKQESLKARLCIRLDAEILGHGRITKQELSDLLGQINVGDKNVMLWTNISRWAFVNRDEEFAAQAVEVLVEHKGVLLQDVSYRRAELLHALLAGSANSDLLIRYFNFSTDQFLKVDFIELVLPVAEELGMVNATLQQLIIEFQAQLEESGSASN